MLQGVVTSRAKRLSALNWNVRRVDRDLKEDLSKVMDMKELYDEYSGMDLTHLVVRGRAVKYIQKMIPGVLPDLSNFQAAVRRYKRQQERGNEAKATEIETWLKEPSLGVKFSDFRHSYVIDLMIHGSASIYKEWQGGRIENFYILPGGTVNPYRDVKVGGAEMYFQIIPTFEPRAYFSNEISYVRYLPVSWQTMGEVPLEALINKVAETILFDKRAADQADGTKPPEKAIAFGKDSNPLGGLTDQMFDIPMPDAEQKRVETKLNQARQEAIVTLTGVGHPAVIDLSKADTFPAQQARQDKLLRDLALIYNMTNMEVNLAGGEFTSGKETSDVQKEIEQEKGLGPVVKGFESLINDDLIPYRFGYGWEFSFDLGMSDDEQIDLEIKKMNSGTYAVNQIREERGDDVFPEDEYNRPPASTQGTAPDGSTTNPFNMTGDVRTM